MGSFLRRRAYSRCGSHDTWCESPDVKITAGTCRHAGHWRIWRSYHRHYVGGDGDHAAVCGVEVIHENTDQSDGGVG